MTNRNYTIDYIKIIAAIGVVMIHTTAYALNTYPLEGLSHFFNTLPRFAVPFFIISSGYFVKDNMKSLISITKLYVFVTVMFSISDPIAKHYFGHTGSPIKWYLPAMMIILVLSANKSKKWTIFLFTTSILYNLALGRLGLFEPLIVSNATSNWITFMWIFLVGRYLHDIDYKINNRVINYLLFLIGFVLSIINGLIHGMQYYFFAQFIAIIIFVPCLGTKSPKMPPIMKGLSMDLFIFHGIFLPIKLSFEMTTVFEISVCVVIISICCAITGYLVRMFDQKVLGGIIY